jgi:phosphomannomutase
VHRVTDLDQIIKAYDVRGLVPSEVNAELAYQVGRAFCAVLAVPLTAGGPGAVVVGHDMRPSGPELVDAFAEGVNDAGADVIRIGLCSTDGLYFASGSLGLPGAMFTASHNPAQYNGIKLCGPGAAPVSQDTGLAQIRALIAAGTLPPPAQARGKVSDRSMLRDYAVFLRGLVDITAIRHLKVVVDAGNGMAGLTAPAVFGDEVGLPRLPITVVPMYFELDGSFPNHEANPIDPENLRDLQQRVRSANSAASPAAGSSTTSSPPVRCRRSSASTAGSRCAPGWATRSSRRPWRRPAPSSAGSIPATSTSGTSGGPTAACSPHCTPSPHWARPRPARRCRPWWRSTSGTPPAAR